MAINNLADYLQNPRILSLKKFLGQLLGKKYPSHDEIVNRIGHNIMTENDLTSFSKLIADIYEVGYLKAVTDHEEQLKKLGYKINITQKNLDDNR